jgi:hypothetical protein
MMYLLQQIKGLIILNQINYVPQILSDLPSKS